MTINELKEKLQSATIVDKFIYINLLIFVITLAVSSFSHLQNNSSNFMLNYFAFDANASNLLFKPYVFITYGFLHLDFIHIIFNLIALYYIGNLFLNYFSNNQFIWYYVLGSIFGASAFYFSFHSFPVFKNSSSYLIGASAGISAILVGLATYIPNYEMNFRLIGYVKLWIIAVVYVLLSLMFIRNGNEGGQIAHLGGAFIGFILTKFIYTRTEYTQSKKPKKSKSNLKKVYSALDKSDDFGMSNHQKGMVRQRKIDQLLDKISKSGYESLSKKEREFLAKASKE